MNRTMISRTILLLGLTPRHKGFHYLSAAVLGTSRGIEPEEAIRLEAEERGEEPARIDRCMRYAIAYAWDVTGGGIRELFPDHGTPPSPTELIYVLFWKMDEEQRIKTRSEENQHSRLEESL